MSFTAIEELANESNDMVYLLSKHDAGGVNTVVNAIVAAKSQEAMNNVGSGEDMRQEKEKFDETAPHRTLYTYRMRATVVPRFLIPILTRLD